MGDGIGMVEITNWNAFMIINIITICKKNHTLKISKFYAHDRIYSNLI